MVCARDNAARTNGVVPLAEHAESPGRPGADVDEPPAALERGHHEIDRARQLGAHGPYGRRHGRILRVDQFDDLERGGDVDALGLGVALLGEPRVAEVGDGHDGGRMAPTFPLPWAPARCDADLRRSRWGLSTHQ